MNTSGSTEKETKKDIKDYLGWGVAFVLTILSIAQYFK
jgi:hypothetical protein